MPRSVDLQLLALTGLVGVGIGWLASRRAGRGPVGALAVVVALLLAWVADRWFVQAVPRDLVDGLGPWGAGAVVGGCAGRGAARLPIALTAGVSPVVPLVLASLAGVWVGVPETSVALVAAGVIVGLVAGLRLGGGVLDRRAAVVVGVVPVIAAVAGAAGDRHALVGGLLCSTTLVALAVAPRITAVAVRPLVVATALQLVGALLAGRQVGVVRDGSDATMVLAAAAAAALGILGASILRRDQDRLGP
jgi:hypothetical protein